LSKGEFIQELCQKHIATVTLLHREILLRMSSQHTQ